MTTTTDFEWDELTESEIAQWERDEACRQCRIRLGNALLADMTADNFDRQRVRFVMDNLDKIHDANCKECVNA